MYFRQPVEKGCDLSRLNLLAVARTQISPRRFDAAHNDDARDARRAWNLELLWDLGFGAWDLAKRSFQRLSFQISLRFFCPAFRLRLPELA